MDERTPGWDEHDSHDFIDLGRFFVPDREEQVAAVLDMVPDPGDGLLVDLCCGEGLLSRALLERFPRARVLAMDLSPAMLEHARAALAIYGELFLDLAAALAPGGAVVIADLVKPATPASHQLAARAWDGAVRRRSLELAGHLGPYEKFRDERWNLYADPEPDPIDQPSPLLDQLRWLEAAGLTGVDVYWLKAGHAVFGGVR